MANITIRPATPGDAPAINEIHAYYVKNTVITFMFEPCTDAETVEKYDAIKSQNLPYIVAVTEEGKVLGYSNCSGFRSSKVRRHCRSPSPKSFINETMRDPIYG